MDRPVVLALIGLVAGTLGALHYSTIVRERLAGGPVQEWLVLKKDLTRGQTLSSDALEVALIPEAYSDSRRIPASEKEALVGIPVALSLKAGEGLYWSDVAGGNSARAHLADVISSGRRAFRLDPSANPFGMLVEAGDLVDVLCSSRTEAKTVLERALVLAVGDKLAQPETTSKRGNARAEGLSLSVLPDEAEMLLRAQSNCDLRVVLRGPEDLAIHGPAQGVLVEAAKESGEVSHVE